MTGQRKGRKSWRSSARRGWKRSRGQILLRYFVNALGVRWSARLRRLRKNIMSPRSENGPWKPFMPSFLDSFVRGVSPTRSFLARRIDETLLRSACTLTGSKTRDLLVYGLSGISAQCLALKFIVIIAFQFFYGLSSQAFENSVKIIPCDLGYLSLSEFLSIFFSGEHQLKLRWTISTIRIINVLKAINMLLCRWYHGTSYKNSFRTIANQICAAIKVNCTLPSIKRFP